MYITGIYYHGALDIATHYLPSFVNNTQSRNGTRAVPYISCFADKASPWGEGIGGTDPSTSLRSAQDDTVI